MNTVLRPLAVLYGYVSEQGSLKFLDRKDVIEIQDHVKEIQAILKHCNGSASLDEIRQKVSEIDEETFEGIIESCLQEGILVDSAQLFKQFHRDSENPPMFGHELSAAEVQKLSRQIRKAPTGVVVGSSTTSLTVSRMREIASVRKSTRSFSKQPVEIDLLLSLLGTMYSTGNNRPTPSAGGLYPMRVLMATADSSQKLSSVLHEYNTITGELVQTGRSISGEQLSRCLDTASALNGIVIFVVCDLPRVTAKYANRGYRLALIEAGHIAQNAYLFAAEQGLAVLELSSFQDKITAEFLGIDYPQEVVLTALVVGYEAPEEKPQFSSRDAYLLHDLKEVLTGPEVGKPVEWVKSVQFGVPPYEMTKNVAVALQKTIGQAANKKGFDQLHLRSTGISTSLVVAQLKALVEAYERHSCGAIRTDFVGTAMELLSQDVEIADPWMFTPYTSVQFEQTLANLTPFNPQVSCEWVMGRHHSSGNSVYVPIELAFYPVFGEKIGRKLCYMASSNGVAAHISYEQALSNALLELVERDAVAVTWYTQRQVGAVDPILLGNDVFLRTERWRKLGWNSKLLDITLDSVPVCLVLFYSSKYYPHLVAGSAAGLTFQSATSKALDEAESMLASWRKMRHSRIRAEDVKSPLDHGLLYYQLRNLNHLDWLLDASKIPVPTSFRTLDQAWTQFNPVIVDLATTTDKIPLYVVRVLSDKLIPINFGFGTEHVDHPRAKMLGLSWMRSYPAQPHMLA